MKINIINPNTSASMTRQIEQAARQWAQATTDIRCVSPDAGTPSVETCQDEAIAAIGVMEQVRAGDHAGADAHIVACFGDPGLDAARELASVPVLGIAQAAFQTAQMLASRFAVITTVPKATTFTRNLLRKYGADAQCAGVWAVNMPVLALEEDTEHTFQTLRTQALICIDKEDADAVVLGCAGMTDLADRLAQDLGIPVIDGVSVAVGMAEMLVQRRLRTSTRGIHAPVAPKRYSGWSAPLAG